MPHVAASQAADRRADPILGSVKLVGPVAKMSGSPQARDGTRPALGEHNAEVLKQLLGYSTSRSAS